MRTRAPAPAVLVMLVVGTAAPGADPPAVGPAVEAPRSPQAVIEEAVEQLGSRSFTVRRAAADRLFEIGAAAIGPLTAAGQSRDLEVSARAIQLILRIGKAGDVETVRMAVEALEVLAASTSEPAASRAARALGLCRRHLDSGLARSVLGLGGSVVVRPDQGSPSAVQHASDLPSGNFIVTAIDLRGSRQVTSDALRRFGLPLDVDHCLLGKSSLDDVALAQVVRWPKLRQLYLEQTAITDTGLKHVTRLKGLQTLWLNGTSVTDAGLVHVAALPRLKSLDLEGTRITDDGVRHLTGLEALAELSLRGTRVTDGALRHLAKLPALQSLTLSETRVSDEGLGALADLKTLDFVDLRGTTVTDEGAAELRKAMPDVAVRR